ncbi:hypothetical protein RHMOL_Rhmol07G0243800 [Rhododendron molle]|uniref:Uncharacterized protein n=1 Tax=Rhododendron molle TaxID=49168 RepID=A0ACC0N4N7_RHOML|nr:hypothetical protein RHMOL_Rhmol07G0243800 [Rhododendron molle]
MDDGRGGISLPRGIFQSLDYRSRKFFLFSPSPPSSSPNNHPPPLLRLFRRAVRRLLDVVACRSWLSKASSSHRSGRSKWVDEVCSGTTDSVRFHYRFFSFFLVFFFGVPCVGFLPVCGSSITPMWVFLVIFCSAPSVWSDGFSWSWV